MTRTRVLIALAVLVVAAGAVVAWRASSEEDPIDAYCAEVKEQQTSLGRELSTGGSATGLINALPAFRILAEKAPEDIGDEWDTVTGRIQALVDAIDDAGADPSTYDRDKPPAGVDKADRMAIDAAAAELSDPESQAAFAAVAQHSRDVCHTPLYLGA